MLPRGGCCSLQPTRPHTHSPCLPAGEQRERCQGRPPASGEHDPPGREPPRAQGGHGDQESRPGRHRQEERCPPCPAPALQPPVLGHTQVPPTPPSAGGPALSEEEKQPQREVPVGLRAGRRWPHAWPCSAARAWGASAHVRSPRPCRDEGVAAREGLRGRWNCQSR